ncbi:hypothetical protein ES677_12935 [Bizionia gelidisalsuginis]|uniref:Uncharacterized protein n=2 Tax=Bizionia TaxID=283785 RepID=A0A8H2QIQ1_9FLAO|nr:MULTISPECIES: hypothetical protein [Bizionia]TYB72512.1 hypothetical protein ES676_11120 [Bizionia saleffrena]TYC09641.1 hypothetical protein ES677_12935 [Bizionia gelidisalsuginis]
MRKLIYTALAISFMTVAFTSCRDEKSQKEELIEEMKNEGAEIKIKTDGEDTKIKMETEDKKVKIKEDGEETKIKIKTDD